MTKLPHENRDVVGLDGPEHPKYTVGPLCSVPSCSRLADHSHHIWRRSFVIGDKPWVKLWDGKIVGNLTGLCWRHHNDVTEGRANIIWNGAIPAFVWDDGGETVFLLDPQPPGVSLATDKISQKLGADFPPGEHEHGPGAVEKCPACHRSLPREKSASQEKRPRKSWSVSVPVDERENGADVLDTLLNECAIIFGHNETKGARYFTLAQALALVVQNKEKFLADD